MVGSTADQILELDLRLYVRYLEAHDVPQRLLRFRARWRELIPEAPGIVCRSTPSWEEGGEYANLDSAVRGSFAHLTSFIAGFRRDPRARNYGMNEPDFDEAGFFMWASGRGPDVLQWV